MASKKRAIKNAAKKKSSGIFKFLEAVVILGAFAAFLMKFLKGKKSR